MVFEQMLEDQNQKEMRIVKMTMTETKKKWRSSKCSKPENKKK